MKNKERLNIFDQLIGIVLIALILLAPLPFGSVAPWAKSAAFFLALVLVGLWLLQSALQGRIRVFCFSPIWILMLVLLALVIFQLLPMDPGLLKSLSPGTAEVYTKTLSGYPSPNETRTLSLDPNATRSTLVHWTTLALIFWVVVNNVRTRRQVTALILALAAVGTFEALYGFAELFSGHRHIFWHERQYHLQAVTGTFHNKNHFAGLLEMIVPVTLGLFMVLNPRSHTSPSLKARIVTFFSSAGTNRQIILGASLVLMTVGIFLSLSRAGILCTLASLAGFILVISLAAGFRRYTLSLMLILLLTLSIALGVGSEMLIDSFENTTTGQEEGSWSDRVDLWQSGLAMINHYPLLGTGLGTFAPAFERFQSMRFGDRYADYLHNDWLQIFCEMGLLGGGVAVLGSLFILYRLLRKTLSRRDPFYRWVALGTMTGTAAILLHSFFDYNLYKITSNGIVFAVILGLWHVSATLHRHGESKGQNFQEIPIRPRAIGWCVAGALMLFMAWPGAAVIQRGLADIHFNHFLASPGISGRADDYHFLKVDEGELAKPGENIQAALALDPVNPRYRYFTAVEKWTAFEKKVQEKARKMAIETLGSEIESYDPEGFKQIVSALSDCLNAQMDEADRTLILDAEYHLRRSVVLSPAVAQFHMELSRVLVQLAQGKNDAERADEAIQEAKTALWLLPNKPNTLFNAGRIFAARGFSDVEMPEQELARDFAVECFRKTLEVDPSYSERIYPLVETAMGGKEALIEVTPQTISCYERLVNNLWESGRWKDVLSCLDTTLSLLDANPPAKKEATREVPSITEKSPSDVLATADKVALDEYSARYNYRYQQENMDEVIRSVSKKRCTVLGILGQWNDRAIEVSRHSRFARRSVAKMIDEAQDFKKLGRYEESFSLYLKALEEDWRNPATLIEAARLAAMPRAQDNVPTWNRPLDLLFRAVINCDSLTTRLLEEVTALLDSLPLEKGEDRLAGELIRGAANILAGRVDDGLEVLRWLADQKEEMQETWFQGHLVWFFMGKGYDRQGDPFKAADAYRKVLDRVPTHLASLERLAGLEREFQGDPGSGPAGETIDSLEERIRKITPEISCRVNFGGRVVLLGLSFSEEESSDSADGKASYLTYHWMFLDRMPQGYHPIVHFCDENWRVLFQDDHRTKYMDRPYPVDCPHSGEVVMDRRRLSNDPTVSRYLKIGIFANQPERDGPMYLTNDGGGHTLTLNSRILAKTTGDRDAGN